MVDAHILAGEAGVCPFGALIAVAWMMARGAGPWYGWSAETTSAVEFVVRYWYTQPDPTPTARFCFSAEDLHSPRVAEIVRSRKLLRQYRCAGGLALYIYE